MASRLGVQQITGTITTAGGTFIAIVQGAEKMTFAYTAAAATNLTVQVSLDGINYLPTTGPYYQAATAAVTGSVWTVFSTLSNVDTSVYSIRFTSSAATTVNIVGFLR